MRVMTINNFYTFDELTTEVKARAIRDYRKNIDWSTDDYINTGVDYVTSALNTEYRAKYDYSRIVFELCDYDIEHGYLALRGKRALTYIYNNYVIYWAKHICNGRRLRASNCTKVADIEHHSNKIVGCLHTALLLFKEGLRQGKDLSILDFYNFVEVYLNQYVKEAQAERSTNDFIISEIKARDMVFTVDGELYY